MTNCIPLLEGRKRLPPNKGLERTALCADKIVAILRPGISLTAFPI
jgi:hypothetical protein